MQYHPSQQIPAQHERLFSKAILTSLLHPQLMVEDLPESNCFRLGTIELPKHPALHFNQKLGHLYEEALAHLLSQDSSHTLLEQNLQIITDERRTIGELDFILREEASHVPIHLELAIKFYLIYHDGAEFRYLGPDARDNYQRKISRLREHQLKLTTQSATQAILKERIGPSALEVRHLIHGIFFDHVDAAETPLPEYASPRCRRRTWLHCSELASHFPEIKTARVLPKQLWLCEMSIELFDALVEVELDELIELGQQRCTMFVVSSDDEPKFLSPDTWPNKT